MNVMVLDGLLNPAVACVRALGKAGYTTIVGAESSWPKARLSRFCHTSFVYPDPKKDSCAFTQCMLATLARLGPALILPSSEPAALALSASRDAITAAGGIVILPTHEAMLLACNKRRTTRRAAELGIATPATWTIHTAKEAAEMARTATIPLVLKPSTSEEVRADRIVPTSRPLYSENPQDFAAAYSKLRDVCSEILVQEFIEGEGVLFCVLLSHGEMRAEFQYKRIRPVHPTGWGAAVRISVRPDPVLREATLTMLRSIDPEWHGVGQLEFRIRPNGAPVFLEVNPRFWHSLPLSIYAGVQFPVLMAQMAEMGDIPTHPGYRDGVRCRWLVGDFRNLLYTWAGRPRGFSGSMPGRLESLFKFLLPVPETSHDNFLLSDPLPELGDWISTLLRVPSRLIQHERRLSSKVRERAAAPV